MIARLPYFDSKGGIPPDRTFARLAPVTPICKAARAVCKAAAPRTPNPNTFEPAK